MAKKQTWAFAVAASLVAMPLGAFAADPATKPKVASKQMTRAELVEHDTQKYREFEAQRADLEKNGHRAPDPWTRKRLTVQVKPHDVDDIRVERYIDGAILYSTPVDPKTEELLYRGGNFRKVSKKEQITDHVVYENRVYRVMRAKGLAKDWQDVVGRDVIVTMQTQGGLQQAMSVRVKR